MTGMCVWIKRYNKFGYTALVALCGHYMSAWQQFFATNVHIVLNTQTNPYFTHATPKNTCQNVLTQENPGIKSVNPQNLRTSLSL